MKTVITCLFTASLLTGCGKGSDNQNPDARNDESNIEENSGENISPQLEDSADRFAVDSISSAREANEEKNN